VCEGRWIPCLYSNIGPYTRVPTAQAKTIGSKTANILTVDVNDGGAADSEDVVKTEANPTSDELKQLDELTSATSAGSAKVISTH